MLFSFYLKSVYFYFFKPYLVNDAQVNSPGSNKSLKQAPPFSINPATQANKVKLKS